MNYILLNRVSKNTKYYGIYKTNLAWIDELFDNKGAPKSLEGKKLQVVLILLVDYDDQHDPIPKPNPLMP